MPSTDGCTIVLFSRVPVPGKTKTRLLPILSAEECAMLQEAMVLDLAEKLASLKHPIILCYSDEWRFAPKPEEAREGFIAKVRETCMQAPNFAAVAQEGADLGERMAHAMQAAFARGADGCVLMGSDLPDIMKNDIELAMRALSYSDVVLGPSADGGYWLVGSRTPFPQLFEDKHYGTGTVLTEAVAACRAHGKTVALSRETFDVDVPEDYFQLCNQVNKGDFRLGVRTVEVVSRLAAVSAVLPDGSSDDAR